MPVPSQIITLAGKSKNGNNLYIAVVYINKSDNSIRWLIAPGPEIPQTANPPPQQYSIRQAISISGTQIQATKIAGINYSSSSGSNFTDQVSIC